MTTDEIRRQKADAMLEQKEARDRYGELLTRARRVAHVLKEAARVIEHSPSQFEHLNSGAWSLAQHVTQAEVRDALDYTAVAQLSRDVKDALRATEVADEKCKQFGV